MSNEPGEIQLFDERMGRLFDAGLDGLWLVNPNCIYEWDDLLAPRPGGIVRVSDIHNSVKFLPHGGEDVSGCIAGWISEGDDYAN